MYRLIAHANKDIIINNTLFIKDNLFEMILSYDEAKSFYLKKEFLNIITFHNVVTSQQFCLPTFAHEDLSFQFSLGHDLESFKSNSESLDINLPIFLLDVDALMSTSKDSLFEVPDFYTDSDAFIEREVSLGTKLEVFHELYDKKYNEETLDFFIDLHHDLKNLTIEDVGNFISFHFEVDEVEEKDIEGIEVIKIRPFHILVRWNSKGERFFIYRSTAKNGKYTKIFETDKLEFKDTNVKWKVGLNYYYKIRKEVSIDV